MTCLHMGNALTDVTGERGGDDSVLTTATIPVADFALEETLSRLPDASVRCESLVDCGDSTLPLLWVSGPPSEEISEALRADPSVDEARVVCDENEEVLYRVSWERPVEFAMRLLTAEGAAVLGLGAASRNWTIRMLFPSRSALGDTVNLCDQYDISVDTRTIGRFNDAGSGLYGLTNAQYESLSLACDRGYYDIPRQAKLNEIANELGISHQAYSERLRRATEGLLEQTILDTDRPDR